MADPNHLSVLGIIHTIISVIALILGLTSLFKTGRIDPASSWGRGYMWLTVITCITGFPIMKTGHLTGGHYLGLLIIVLLPIGIYAHRIFGKAANYVQTVVMSTTLFLSFIPAIIETLTRLPMSHPLAWGPADPIIQKAISALLLVYVIGILYQVMKLRAVKKVAA
jgi:hypothetical protein